MIHHFLVISLCSLAFVLTKSGACDLPLPQLQPSLCPGPPAVYTVKPSQDKGLGVFAAHDLDIGDIVMRETPILKITPPAIVKGSGYPMSIVSELVRKEFESLSPDEQEEVLSLTYHAATAEGAQDKLGIIFKTNAYNTGNEVGLFPKIARINHSCRPNTSYYWSEKLNKRIVYATRKIKRGEELFVSYIPLLLSRKERQVRLDRYGFKCRCDACVQEHVALKASDNRRITLKKAFTDFEPQLTLTPPKTKKANQQARKNAMASVQLTKLVHEEGLADYYAKAYRIAAISHARVKEWELAVNWANKGYELKFMEDPHSVYTSEMHNLTSSFIESWESELRTSQQRAEQNPDWTKH